MFFVHKPKILMPFIFVYKLVFAIIKVPYNIVKYFFLGYIYVINFLLRIIQLFIEGVIWCSYFLYKTFKYTGYGFKFSLILLTKSFKNNKELKEEKILNKQIIDKEKINDEINNEVKEVIIEPEEDISNIKLNDVIDNNKMSFEEAQIDLNQKIEISNDDLNIDYENVDIDEKELVKLTKEKLKIQNKIKKEKLDKEKADLKEAKLREKEERKKLKLELKKELKQKSNDSYVNEKVDIKKPGFFDDLKDLGKKINAIPNLIIKKFNNNDFIKHSRNQKEMQREALLINFEGEDVEKSDVKILYEYVAKNKEGQVIKGYFEAFSKVEVHSYLLSEGFEVYSIKTNKWIKFFHGRSNVNHTKIKIKDLIFFLTQLSTYLKAGIPLVESLRILAKQFKKKSYKRIFDAIIYDLTTGENFSEALLKQNVAFPRLLINMIKTAEMTGELPEVLDDMANYYTATEKTRKQMVTALMYPSLVLVFATGVITFIMMFVIPQFVEIYETMDASQIPSFTLLVMAVSEFIQNYIVWILIGTVILILIYIYLYNNVKIFRTVSQWIFMHIPVIGTTVIYNEVTMFTKTFASLLFHNVFITDSMEVLNKITNNEIYKMLILDTITNLAKGDKISTAFEGHWAFPVPAYEMLVTGEKTGELAEMMAKVADYYQNLHAESVTRIKTFVEPILTVFLTVIVGIIILAVIIPMFSMYQSIQSY
ncbi:MAG: type II secretion system F family protein [Bacilli bacterium]|nr:type II secretion system F family protein [Bacilli bacterium]